MAEHRLVSPNDIGPGSHATETGRYPPQSRQRIADEYSTSFAGRQLLCETPMVHRGQITGDGNFLRFESILPANPVDAETSHSVVDRQRMTNADHRHKGRSLCDSAVVGRSSGRQQLPRGVEGDLADAVRLQRRLGFFIVSFSLRIAALASSVSCICYF